MGKDGAETNLDELTIGRGNSRSRVITTFTVDEFYTTGTVI
jgi:hypothetical protein